MKIKYLINFVIVLFCFNAIYAQEKMPESTNVFQLNGTTVYGQSIDKQTRCIHWHSALDVIAIKFKCCDKYYPCFSCHEKRLITNTRFGLKLSLPKKLFYVVFVVTNLVSTSIWNLTIPAPIVKLALTRDAVIIIICILKLTMPSLVMTF